MQLIIPTYIEDIQSLDLSLVGKCTLSAYAREVIVAADIKTGISSGVNNPFGYFLNICKLLSIEKGLEIDRDFSDSLFQHFNVKKTDNTLNSPVIRKLAVEFKDTKKTYSKAQESTGPSTSDTNAAIKKQIADAKERQANPMDRSGLEEFIRMHLAGEIAWADPKAKEFADILVGNAVKNKQEVAEGKPFMNPISAWTSSILSHVEITPKEAADLHMTEVQQFETTPKLLRESHQVEHSEPDEVVEQEFDYSTLEEVY
jgi:hypothetical protein